MLKKIEMVGITWGQLLVIGAAGVTSSGNRLQLLGEFARLNFTSESSRRGLVNA